MFQPRNTSKHNLVDSLRCGGPVDSRAPVFGLDADALEAK